MIYYDVIPTVTSRDKSLLVKYHHLGEGTLQLNPCARDRGRHLKLGVATSNKLNSDILWRHTHCDVTRKKLITKPKLTAAGGKQLNSRSWTTQLHFRSRDFRWRHIRWCHIRWRHGSAHFRWRHRPPSHPASRLGAGLSFSIYCPA